LLSVGIMSGADAAAKIAAGASLVQLYTGFIYRGPALVAEAAGGDRPPAPCLNPESVGHNVVECVHLSGDNRAALIRPAFCPSEP
jgi:hypothetical protein